MLNWWREDLYLDMFEVAVVGVILFLAIVVVLHKKGD